MEHLIKAAVFLVDVIFGVYIFLLMLRFLLQWVRIDFYHPMSQFLLMATSPPLRPLQRVIPNWKGLNLAALVLMLLLQICKRLITHSLIGIKIMPFGILILSIADLLSLLLYVFIFSIIIQAVLSWVQLMQQNGYGGGGGSELGMFLYRLNDPLLRPVRQRVPPYNGIDFSPMLVIVGLYLLIILVVGPLHALGAYL